MIVRNVIHRDYAKRLNWIEPRLSPAPCCSAMTPEAFGLFTTVGDDTDNIYFLNEISNTYFKVNYCPFCGEKMRIVTREE